MLSVLTHKKRKLKQVNKTHFSTVDRNNNKTRKLHHMDKIPVIQFQVGQRQSTCRSKKTLQLSNCRIRFSQQLQLSGFPNHWNCGLQDKSTCHSQKLWADSSLNHCCKAFSTTATVEFKAEQPFLTKTQRFGQACNCELQGKAPVFHKTSIAWAAGFPNHCCQVLSTTATVDFQRKHLSLTETQ